MCLERGALCRAVCSDSRVRGSSGSFLCTSTNHRATAPVRRKSQGRASVSRAKATSIRAWLEGAGHRQVRVEAAYFMTLQYTLTSSGTCPRRSRLGGIGMSSGSETQAASHAGCEEGTCPADGTAPSRTGLQGPALRGREAGGRPWRPGRGVCGAGRGDTGCTTSAPARACTPERLHGRRRPVGRPAPGPRRLQPQPRPLRSGL